MPALPHKLIEELQASGSLKVWSLIITFFGDAVEPRGGIVAASTLQTVMKVMGVGPGAVRTACSRLAKDGWIERQKQGRNSFYRLSDMGHTPFRKASQQIYAPPQTHSPTHTSLKAKNTSSETEGKFTLIIQNPLNTSSSDWQSLRDKGIRINGNTVLFDNDSAALKRALENMPETEDMLVLSNATARFPDWIKRSVCSDESAQRYLKLLHRFESIPDNLPTDPLISLAVRCLLIHEWRRLLLRSAPVPAELVPVDWPHNTCHEFVASLYQQLFVRGEQWMDQNAVGPGGSINTKGFDCSNRFSTSDNTSA